ncbi:MAG: hypothetical protein GY711_23030 [bacterium]|nr:hypothetical protein [bacterium]
MLRFIAVGALLTAVAPGQTVWTQCLDNSYINHGTNICQSFSPLGDSSHWRAYSPAQENQTRDFQIEHVTFGINLSQWADGLPVKVNLYADTSPGAPGPFTDLTLLATAEVVVYDDPGFETAVFDPPVPFFIGSGADLAVEVFLDVPDNNFTWIVFGANEAGQTLETYFHAVNCGFPDPVPLTMFGFPPERAGIVDVGVSDLNIGTRYCETNLNSSGFRARIYATGSRVLAANDLMLAARQLPPNQFGYFLMSDTQAFVPYFGGSLGILCLGLPIERFSNDVLSSGPLGEVSFALDWTQLPGGLTVQVGETWNFQYWFRDVGNTSNTSDAVSMTLE